MASALKTRAEALRLYGLLAHWGEVADCDWLARVIAWEEQERQDRSLQRRLATARIGRFKPLADFDWRWPKRCDRAAIEALMGLDFLDEAANVLLFGPQGVGKSTIAANLAHRAVLEGHTVRFVTAAAMLGELAAIDSDSQLQRRLELYARPQVADYRRGRLSLLQQPPRRPAVPHRQPPPPAALDHRHHQPAVQRMAPNLSWRRLRGRPDRPAGAERRDHHHRGRLRRKEAEERQRRRRTARRRTRPAETP